MTTCDYTKGTELLNVDHVSLTLNDNLILRNVSTKINDVQRLDTNGRDTVGQVVCFLGPSGIGKTRLSRIIAGLDQPTSGRVLVQNRPIKKGIVGMVPQNYPLFEFLSVEQNLLLSGQQGGLTKAQAIDKMYRFLDEFDLTKYRAMYPSHLSGGTRQRVAIIRQLMCSEHFVVMDEPFSGLDPIMKRRATAMIQRVANMDGLNTIIVVTHDVTEGMSVADTVWLMGLEPNEYAPGCYQSGARIIEEYDLAARGLCWQPDGSLATNTEFLTLVAEIKNRFTTLTGPVKSNTVRR